MKKIVTKPVKEAANCSNLEVMCQTTRNDPGLGRRRMTITDQARVIRDYMAFRAGREKVPHDLTFNDYRREIERGALCFFGVTVGPHGLVSDEQAPHLFREWMNTREQAG